MKFSLIVTLHEESNVRMEISSDGSSRELTLAASGGTIKKDDNFPAPFNVTSNNNSMIIELWTYDQGVTVFARYLGTYA